jgi:Tfp pilus assembly protein PilZ
MSKLRMEKRRKVTIFTPVYDVHTNTLLGYLGDLTLKGALMVSEKPVEVGQTLTMAIEFRDTPEAAPSMHMIISARVAWCKLEEHRTHYNTGMEFLETTEQNKQVIEAVLEKHEFSRKMPKKE